MAVNVAAKRRQTTQSDTYLKSVGIAEAAYADLSERTRRLLASALQQELKQFDTLSPHARRVVEADLIDSVDKACGLTDREGRDKHLAPPESLAKALEYMGGKTAECRAAIGGICEVLRAPMVER